MTKKGSPQQGSSSSSVGGVTIQDLQRIPTHFFTEGVVESVSGQLEVTERGAGANMSVDVAAGLCLIEITTTLLETNYTVKTWLQNTATVNVPVPTADATNERIDRIVARFDMTTDPEGSLGNNVSIELIEGTPAGSPSAPAIPSNAISLATISVPASDTTISNAQITDTRTYIELDTSTLQDVARVDDLASSANGKGASTIGIEDSGGNYSATDVETAFSEVQAKINTVSASVAGTGDGSDGALNVTSGTTQIDASGAVNGILIKQYTSFNVSVGATLEFINVPSSGITFVPLCQGDFTVAGTIDGQGDGTQGASGATVSRTSDGGNTDVGNTATDVDAVLRFGQTRYGGVGEGDQDQPAGNTCTAAASGGASGANPSSDGNDSSAASQGTSSVSAALGGSSLTSQILNVLANFHGISLFPGVGGSTGGVAVRVSGFSSGTISATSGDGGDGGASMLAIVGGNYSMTGTINLSGTNASSSSVTLATLTGANRGQAAAAGGSAPGSSGCFAAFVKGTITNSGTYTLSAGTASNGASNANGAGDGGTSAASASNGAAGVDGEAVVCPYA